MGENLNAEQNNTSIKKTVRETSIEQESSNSLTNNLIIEGYEPYYTVTDFSLYLGDCLSLLKRIPDNSINVIFADPPYFLSGGGVTCSGGKMVSVNKASWDTQMHIQEIHSFNKDWLSECQRILKKNGTIWITGTFHNIYSVGLGLQELGYKILNNITWYKSNPPPNLSCRYFTHSTETILWASKNKKSKHYFNYAFMKELNNGKQMRDVWEFPVINKKEKIHGNHPTQKPKKLLERIIVASSEEGDVILDPFNGSGTTGIAANELKRKYIGIDITAEYLDITIKRFKNIQHSFL
jgi:site-specific DNA-methyltransferase (adenine-specific)